MRKLTTAAGSVLAAFVLVGSVASAPAGAAQTAGGSAGTRHAAPAQATAPAVGRIIFVGTPGTGKPPLKLGHYVMRKAPPDSRPLYGKVTTVKTGQGLLRFGRSLTHYRIGHGWATWSHGYAGPVYYATGYHLTLTLPAGTKAFYLYAEPNRFKAFGFRVTAQNGVSSGNKTIQGSHGALFFGFYCTGTMTLKSIKIDSGDSQGFAVGEFGIRRVS